jgi:hypothetical protein
MTGWPVLMGVLRLGGVAEGSGAAGLPGPVRVLFVEAVNHGAGDVGIQFEEDGWLTCWVHERGDCAGLVDATVAEPLFDCFLQVVSEPERLLVLVAEVAHGDLPRSDRG